jgi:hypothetical protein
MDVRGRAAKTKDCTAYLLSQAGAVAPLVT